MAFHIHVPKPLHGWKAMINEVFVIAPCVTAQLERLEALLGRIYTKVILLRGMNTKSEDLQGRLTLQGYPLEQSADLRAELLRDILSQKQRAKANAINSAQTLSQFRLVEFAPSIEEIEARRAALTPGKTVGLTAFQYCQRNSLPLADWRAEVAKAKI